MSDKGIIFSAPMVLALLAGRKTQTRRLFKPRGFTFYTHPQSGDRYDHHMPSRGGLVASGRMSAFGWGEHLYGYLPYAPGDRLYVRESCYLPPKFISDHDMREGADTWPKVIFAADDREGGRDMMERCRWRSTPSIHMPRWASRLTLTVTSVRVERVASISRKDAIAEGIHLFNPYSVDTWSAESGGAFASWPEGAFMQLWNALHTKPGETWADNPWVVAITFDVRHGNIDR